MVVNGARRVSSWHLMDHAHMPCLDRGVQEVAYARAPTAAGERSGVCRTVADPTLWDPARLGRARRACGLRADGALPLPGRAGGLHQPRPGGCAGTLKLVARAQGDRRARRVSEWSWVVQTVASAPTRRRRRRHMCGCGMRP